MADTPQESKNWQIAREKNWDELDGDGKLQRMRGIIKYLQDAVRRLESRAELLERHSHDSAGDLLVHLRDKAIRGEVGSGRSSDWF